MEEILERELKLYDKISVVDLEIVPAPLQSNIIKGERLYLRHEGQYHARRIVNSIYSKIEKDYGEI